MDHRKENECQRSIGSTQGMNGGPDTEGTRFNDLHVLAQPSTHCLKQRGPWAFLLGKQRLHVLRDVSMEHRSHMAIRIQRERDRAVT